MDLFVVWGVCKVIRVAAADAVLMVTIPLDDSLEYGSLLSVPFVGGADDRVVNRGSVGLQSSGGSGKFEKLLRSDPVALWGWWWYCFGLVTCCLRTQ
ncbi:hypothetical protein ACIPY2_13765, partial [Paenarthrobacter sp. NPDC089675]|uniref:hypothetical protein n=1 Tax=Paenarthrobacter sp. NPDC089675 TaxID=3364376 RepID=UPI0037F444C3